MKKTFKRTSLVFLISLLFPGCTNSYLFTHPLDPSLSKEERQLVQEQKCEEMKGRYRQELYFRDREEGEPYPINVFEKTLK